MMYILFESALSSENFLVRKLRCINGSFLSIFLNFWGYLESMGSSLVVGIPSEMLTEPNTDTRLNTF